MKATFIKTLLPWICYAGLNFLGFPRFAAPVALLALVAGCLILGFKPVDWVLSFYFGVLTVGIGLLHWAWLIALQPVLAPGLLAAMAFATVLLRRPFTLPYARESVKDPVLWESPHFYRVNMILSVLWGSAFLVGALGQAWALGRPGMNWFAALGAFAVTGMVAWVTCWFPAWYHKRYYEPDTSRAEVAG